MEALWSDLQALKKLYGLLQINNAVIPEKDSKESLDEQSRLLLKKLLDGATQEALQCHSKILSPATDNTPQNPQCEQQSRQVLSPIPGGAREEDAVVIPWGTKEDTNPRSCPDRKSGIELKRQKSQKTMKPHNKSEEQPVLQDRCGHRPRARSGRSSAEDAPNGTRRLMRLASQRGRSPKRSRVESAGPSRSGVKVPRGSTERRPMDSGTACCSLTRRPESSRTNQTPEIARSQRKEVGPTQTELLDSRGSTRRELGNRLQKPPIQRTSPSHVSRARRDMEARPLEALAPHHHKKTAMKDHRGDPKRQSSRMPTGLQSMRQSSLRHSSGSSGSMPNGSTTSTNYSDSECRPAGRRPTRPSMRQIVHRRMPSSRLVSSSRPAPAPQPELVDRRARLPRWKAVGLPQASSGGDPQKMPEKREGRLKRLKNKLAIIFHHHHHHHHYRHDEGGARKECPQVSPSRYAGSILQNTSKKDHGKLATRAQGERAAERALGQRPHGHLYGLFDALLRHIWGTSQRRAAQAKRTLRGKKLHWWHKFRRRGGIKLAIPRKPRLHLGSATTHYLSGNKKS